jgi:hypothetical protein
LKGKQLQNVGIVFLFSQTGSGKWLHDAPSKRWFEKENKTGDFSNGQDSGEVKKAHSKKCNDLAFFLQGMN